MLNLETDEVPERLRAAIRFNLGDEAGDDWLIDALAAARGLAARWGLQPEEILLGGAMSLCVRCSRDGTPVVVKIPTDPSTGALERSALGAWSGAGGPVVLDHDIETASILMEYLVSAPTRVDQQDAWSLCRRIHDSVADLAAFPPVTDNIAMRVDWATLRFAVPEYEQHRPDLATAVQVLDAWAERARRPVLLHGDFQAKNLFMTREGLRVLDPLPCVGDPLFDHAFWIALGNDGPPMSELVERGVELDRDLDGSTMRAVTWALAVVEHRPYAAVGSERRQELVNALRGDAASYPGT